MGRVISIVLADDHKMLRQGIKLLIETEPGFKVVGEAEDGLQAVKLVSELHPDVLVTDLAMPGADGITVTKETVKVSPNTKVVLLSLYGHVVHASEALKAGAKAYVLKDATVDNLIDAINAVLEDRTFLTPPLSQERIEEYRRDENKLRPPEFWGRLNH